jgi:ankyrin repeat protein
MNTRSSELMQKYLLAIATEEEVHELENRLESDIELQHEFLLQVEIDAHLRQEAQSLNDIDASGSHRLNHEPGRHDNTSGLWKWVAGISTLAAAILLAFFFVYFPPARPAMAAPSLDKLLHSVSWTKRNIWVATLNGDLPMLDAELHQGVAVDARTEEAYTPLHIAAVFGQTAAAELLLSHNADVSLSDNDGNTALHMAVFLGHTDVVRTLLAHGADPLARNRDGFSPVDCAGAPWTRDYEAHLRQAEVELKTPLDLNRIRGERLTILKLLVGGDRAAEQASEPFVILNAAIAGDIQSIQKHLAGGNNLNVPEQVGGNTPLMLAATFGNRDAASLLIQAGADLEIRNKSGGTALHQACFFAQPQIVELLLDAGADPTKLNNYGATPLELAPEHLDSEWKAVYEHVYQSLNLELDFEVLGDAHARIRNVFKERSIRIGKTE